MSLHWLLWALPCEAGPVDVYGFGAAAMGRGLGGVALSDGVGGMFNNPASLQQLESSEAIAGYALLRHDLTELPGVRWDTNQDGFINDADEPLYPPSQYGRADGLMIGLGRNIGDRLGLGIAAFMPVDRLMDISTFDAQIPTWFMYRSRMHRFEAAVGGGWEMFPGLSVGGAVEIIAQARFSMRGTLSASVTGAQEGDEELGELVGDMTLDIHEMSLNVEPNLAPIIAFIWDVGQLIEPLDGLSLGGTWRGTTGLPVDVDIDLQINASIEDVGDFEATTITLLAPFELLMFDHYVPSRLSLGAAWRWRDTLRVYGDLRRTAWDEMQLNIAQVIQGSVSGQLIGEDALTLNDGNAYDLVLIPTWSSRTGIEVRLPDLQVGEILGVADFGTMRPVLRAGWSFEPTPLIEMGTDVALLDTDRMVFTGGIGLEHGSPFGLMEGPVVWDAFFQHHALAAGNIPVVYSDKYSPGAPVSEGGIPVGGRLWAAGVQGSMYY
ncbi:MAG: long-subunit fatty acid transport protein [Myxococcota bacterium]|jgi:long-subunit fatty acid transport protein